MKERKRKQGRQIDEWMDMGREREREIAEGNTRYSRTTFVDRLLLFRILILNDTLVSTTNILVTLCLSYHQVHADNLFGYLSICV